MLTHAELCFDYWEWKNAAENADGRVELPIVLFLKGASTILMNKKGKLQTDFVEEFQQKSDQVKLEKQKQCSRVNGVHIAQW